MTDIIDRAIAQVGESMPTKKRCKDFLAIYKDKKPSEVDWLELCDDVEEYKCYTIGFHIVLELLRNNLYCGSYADDLYENLEIYNELAHKPHFGYTQVLCGKEVAKQIIYSYRRNPDSPPVYRFQPMNTENKFIKYIFTKYLKAGRSMNRWCPNDIAENFEESFGKYRNTIASQTDFTPKTLFTQIDFYKERLCDDAKRQLESIKLIVGFYRWIVRTYPEHDFFANSFSLSDQLLFSMRFPELLQQDYYFTYSNPANIPYGKERICFLFKGLDSQSTRLTNNDFTSFDFSVLQNQFYRDLAIEFITTSPTVTAMTNCGIVCYICDAMQALYLAKQSKGYPNKKLNYLTNQEAIFIRQYFEAQDVQLATKNNKIGAVRRFIGYCVDKKAIQTDDLFFDYLRQYEEPNKNTAKTVSDDDLVAIHKELLKRSSDNLFYKEMLVIFHLAIQTEFRINQICHLQIDCIKPTVKPNQFMVQSNSKTSYGRKNNYVISTQTYRLLMDIIEETEEIREKKPFG